MNKTIRKTSTNDFEVLSENDRIMKEVSELERYYNSQEYKDKVKKHSRILTLHELYTNRFVFFSFTLYGAVILGLIFLIQYLVS